MSEWIACTVSRLQSFYRLHIEPQPPSERDILWRRLREIAKRDEVGLPSDRFLSPREWDLLRDHFVFRQMTGDYRPQEYGVVAIDSGIRVSVCKEEAA